MLKSRKGPCTTWKRPSARPSVDVLTRYSSRQYLVILVGAKADGVRNAVDRIFRGYYKMNGSGAFTPSYTAADPDEAMEQAAEQAAEKNPG